MVSLIKADTPLHHLTKYKFGIFSSQNVCADPSSLSLTASAVLSSSWSLPLLALALDEAELEGKSPAPPFLRVFLSGFIALVRITSHVRHTSLSIASNRPLAR